jgi:hypothetical protein
MSVCVLNRLYSDDRGGASTSTGSPRKKQWIVPMSFSVAQFPLIQLRVGLRSASPTCATLSRIGGKGVVRGLPSHGR